MKLKLLSRFLVLIFLFLTSSLITLHAQDTDPKNDVMMQGFWWDSYQDPTVSSEGGLYAFLKARAGQLQATGIDVIWTPPPSQGAGMAYFPQQLNDFNNAHGSEAQLKSMLATFKAKGMHGMADVVANHRNGTTGWSDFTNPTWGCEALVENDEVKGVAGQVQPCSGKNDEGEGFDGVRDLNHQSATVLNGYKSYLTSLKALGFDSWRWDFTKGFPAKYVAEYNATSSPYFSVGEYFDANISLLTGWVNASGNRSTGGTTARSATFDFSLFYILDRAVKGAWWELNNGGKMPGLAGTYGYADYAVTFAENHDAHNISGNANIMKANAYILTHPGIPMVFMKHWLNNKQKINELIAVRKQNGITAWSTITIDQSSSFYAAYIDGKVAVKIGPGSWSPAGTGWILNTSGTDYAVWSKKTITTPTVIPEPYLSISMIGPAVGSWTTDVPMTTEDGVTYKLYSKTFSAGAVKFRAGNSWTTNWGDSSFPTGVGTQDGKNIPVVAGTYNVTFNVQTGAFSFGAPTTAPPTNFAKRYLNGVATNNQFVPLTTTDGYNYSLLNYQFAAGGVKFRDTTSGGNSWGDSSFPTGNAVYTNRTIPVTAGNYSVKYNKITGYYDFFSVDSSISLIGTGVGGWTTDVTLKSFDQVTYTLDYTLVTGEVKFRKDKSWSTNWGAATFPTGTGTQDGPNIPVTAGTYKITFIRTTGAYEFKSVTPVITSFTPTTQSTGGTVTIKGKNFAGTNAVTFGNVAAASFTILNDSTISAKVGNGASGAVKITTPYGSPSLAGFTFQCAPVTMSSLSAGTTVLCTNKATVLTANGVTGTNAIVKWYTAANAGGTLLGTGTTLNISVKGIYYARATGTCGSPVDKSITVYGDTVKPTITCPGNIVVNNGVGCTRDISIPNPVFGDNCSIKSLTYKATGATAITSATTGINFVGTKTFKQGTTTITYTLKDSANNTAICSFTVKLADTLKPVFQSFVSKVFDTTNVGCDKRVKLPIVKFKDNCGVPVLTWIMTGANTGSGTGQIDTMDLRVGITTVKYTLKDAAFNTSTATLTYSLIERVAPNITCPANITKNNVAACSTSVSTPAPVYSDNCNVKSLTWTMTGATVAASPTTGIKLVGSKVFNAGTTTVKYIIKDSSNNAKQCTFNVVVNSTATCSGSFARSIVENVMESEEFNVRLSSNPTTSNFGLNIQSGSEEKIMVNVFGSDGKRVEQFITNSSKTIMLGNNYRKGIYLIEVIQGENRKTLRAVKQ